MKSCIRKMALVLSMICIVAFASPLAIFAGNLDDLSSGSTTQNNPNNGYDSSQSNQEDGAIADYLHGYTPVTQDNMQKAGSMASPIVSALGTLSGFIVMITSAGIFVVTALDLCYIGLPFTRSILNPQMAGGAQGGGMPMGGMGMGMRGGMMGGMGAMGGGAQGVMPEQGLRRKWVSDEAVACVNLANMQNQQGAGSPMGGMGGMGGMGMGGMGMGGMGGMGAMGGAPAQPAHTKSIILEYLKKRMFFIIVFTIATVILMSSLLTDCGLNLAELFSKVMSKFNGQIANVNI